MAEAKLAELFDVYIRTGDRTHKYRVGCDPNWFARAWGTTDRRHIARVLNNLVASVGIHGAARAFRPHIMIMVTEAEDVYP